MKTSTFLVACMASFAIATPTPKPDVSNYCGPHGCGPTQSCCLDTMNHWHCTTDLCL